MIITGQTIDFNQLAKEIGVDVEYLTPLFEVLQRECVRLFPLLEEAISLQNYSALHESSHAFKGIIGNMRFDDLHKMITEFDNAAKTEDSAYPYSEQLNLVKSELTNIFNALSALNS